VSAVTLIAGQEIRINLRNRWVLSFAVLFTILTLGIAYFGMVTSGYTGFQDFRRTSASIINLVSYLVPLFALLMGVFSFVSNREYLDLLVSQTVARWQIIIG
jgi:Cu-processing system permease protein